MLSQKSLVKLVAQHPYHSRDPTHLSFPAQAIISAQPGQDGNTLWYGSYGSQSGWFSPSYCRLQPTLRRPAQVRHHVSFSGSSSPHQYSAPARAHSWNAPMHSLQESPSKESSGERDTMTTEDESRSSSAQSEAVDEQKRQQDSEELLEADSTRTQSCSTPPRPIDTHDDHSTSCGDDAVSCTETTPKRRNRPMLALRFNQGIARRRTNETVSPSKPEVARPTLFSSASKLRSFFKERQERQVTSQIDTMSPPSCIYIECTSPPPPEPPLPRKPEVREPPCQTQQSNVFLEERIHDAPTTEFSASGPVDPIEVWAAEFRLRQQQLLLQRQPA